MALRGTETTIRTLDGLRLSGTLVTPEAAFRRAVVLIHGGGVTREEGGFFTQLATGLAGAGVASLRFDLRGHGESDGRQQEMTLSAHLNDIRVALAHVREATRASHLSLVGASFGGGLCVYYAAKRPDELTRLVLLNPQLNYKDRYIDQKPHWTDDYLDEDAARQLSEYQSLVKREAWPGAAERSVLDQAGGGARRDQGTHLDRAWHQGYVCVNRGITSCRRAAPR